MWTIQYFGATTVEKPFAKIGALAGWGISGECPFEFYPLAKSAIHILTSDQFDANFAFAYGKKIVIWRDRVYAAGAFSGGTRWFQGFVREPARLAAGARQNHQYTFYDWMELAERIGFRQPYRQRSGGTVTAPTYITQYTDEIVLGETIDEGPQDVQAQITEILTSMNQRHNPTRWRSYGGAVDASQDLVQIGAIAGAGVPMPRNPMRCVKCFEVLREVLRQIPDCVLWTDYSTTPPTVNVTAEGAMATATVTLPSNDVTAVFRGLKMQPRYERQLNGFLIAYKMPGEITLSTGGTIQTMQFFFDKYPLTCDVDDPLVESYVIELAAARSTRTIVSVCTKPVNAAHVTDATRLAWWQANDDRLKSARIVAGTLHVDLASVVVLDKDGAVVDLADYPYQLMPDAGAPIPAMGVNVKEVTITANASWHRYLSDIDVVGDKEEKQQIHARITICDLDTGGVVETFTIPSVEETGETAPAGLAEYLFNAYTSLQFTGMLDTVGQNIRGDLALGKKLTINTPASVFANNLIQSVTGEIFRGVLKAEIGPPGVLGLNDRIAQMRVVRYIPNWKLPSGRSNGAFAGGGSASLSNATAKENTIPGFGEPSLHTTSAEFIPT